MLLLFAQLSHFGGTSLASAQTDANLAAHLHRLLTPPPASSAKSRVHWLLRAMRPLPPHFVVIIFPQMRSCKSSATVKKYNLLIICAIEITSVADGINLASSGTP